MWVKDTKSTRVGQTVFFRNKYITQPVITPTDAILRATDDLCDVLRGKQIVRSDTRSAIDMLVDIFKGYKGEPTEIDKQRADMKKQPRKEQNQKRLKRKYKTSTRKIMRNSWKQTICGRPTSKVCNIRPLKDPMS